MSDEVAIRAVGLTRRFETVTAVDGLDLEVRTGTVFGFLGPNGAGKTTTIRLLLGLLEPTAGHASVLGHDAIGEGGARCADSAACSWNMRGSTSVSRPPTTSSTSDGSGTCQPTSATTGSSSC